MSHGWVVLKFGGTSVSSPDNWRNIVRVLRDRMQAGLHPVVVHSALSGITDRLESLLIAAITGTHRNVLVEIETVHRELAQRLSIVPNGLFERFLADLERMAESIAASREVDDRMRARVMASGSSSGPHWASRS